MSRSTQIYPSKRDPWLVGTMGAGIFVIALSAAVIVFSRPLLESTLTAAIALIAIGFMFWILFGTQYRIDERTLLVVSGPFRWRVPIDSIISITATHNPLSAPALSLDRLEICYGRQRSILVSPQDRAGFLQALGRELET